MTVLVKTARRFYLLKGQALLDVGQATAEAYFAKQEAEASIALPLAFPLRDKLIAAHYSTKADLDGTDVSELRSRAGLTRAQAEAVIAAIPTIV